MVIVPNVAVQLSEKSVKELFAREIGKNYNSGRFDTTVQRTKRYSGLGIDCSAEFHFTVDIFESDFTDSASVQKKAEAVWEGFLQRSFLGLCSTLQRKL